MAPTRLMISTDFHGSTTQGDSFDDSLIFKDVNNPALTKIVLYYGHYIDSLTVRLSIILVAGAG